MLGTSGLLILFSGAGGLWIEVGLVLLVLAVLCLVPRRLPEGWQLVDMVVDHTRRRLEGVIVVLAIGAVAGGLLTVSALATDDFVVAVLVAGLLLLLACLGGLWGAVRERREATRDIEVLQRLLHEQPAEVAGITALRTRAVMLGTGIVHGVEVTARDGRSWTLLGRPAENRAFVEFLRTICPGAVVT